MRVAESNRNLNIYIFCPVKCPPQRRHRERYGESLAVKTGWLKQSCPDLSKVLKSTRFVGTSGILSHRKAPSTRPKDTCVGRTHTIVRLQTWNRRKDHGTENFGGFVYVLDGFPQHVFVLWVFMCPTNITLFCLYLFCVSFPATTPRATTPHPYHHGLPRLCIHPGYHTRAITLHHTRTSGHHTRH